MKNGVNAIPLIYGDAEFCFYNINIHAEADGAPIWHRHGYYEIHVCRRDALRYTFEDKTVTLQAGQILIISPGMPHVSIDRNLHSSDDVAVLSFDLKQIKGGKDFLMRFRLR